jgi:hypothetical protein
LLASLLENANNAFHEHFESLSNKSLDKIKNNFDECAALIDKFDLCQIVTDYKVLVGYVFSIKILFNSYTFIVD